MYSAAAGAAGAGLLALAQPASGEIVYTHINLSLTGHDNQHYPLSLTNTRTADFVLLATWKGTYLGSGGGSNISVLPVKGNGVAGFGGSAAALMEGDTVDSAHQFLGREMAWMETFFGSDFGAGGKWKNVKNGYLGLKFQIAGKTHYGWARLTIRNQAPLTAVLTGYAYETEPNTAIVAGDTSGTDEENLSPSVSPESQADAPPATLGVLALGAQRPFVNGEKR
jgi:hypothetical protein